MFQSESLSNHLKNSDTIKTNSKTFVEWNLNDPENVKRLGNYRYRPSDSASPYYLIPSNYIDIEPGPIYYYTGATDSDIAIENGFNDLDEPIMFISEQTKMKMLFSLEDCIKPFRPRSGINKLLYLGSVGTSASSGQYIDDGRSDSARRPRYYMASRDDQFKYWTSFRKSTNVEEGVSQNNAEESIRGVSFVNTQNDQFYIDDACPFVVYNDSVPTNKIVVKMQTNVGEVGIGQLRYNEEIQIPDPLFGNENKTIPRSWRIEALKENSWTTLISFDENSLQENGDPLIGADGYLEISYGFIIPEQYKDTFIYAGEIGSESLLPTVAPNGYCYLIKESSDDIGRMHIYLSSLEDWETFTPEYNWKLSSQAINNNSHSVKKLVDPEYFIVNNEKKYREFEFINGIRIVVQTMNKSNCTFDLIEFSPRLFAEITDSVQSISIQKTLADLGNSSIPVGGLFASTGSVTIFDVDFSFNENNVFDKETSSGSIVYKYLDNMMKFIFYNSVLDVDGYDYYIPIKTLYSFGFPQSTSPTSSLQIQLRDFFFFLESSQAPQLLLTDISLSYAIMILLDYIGFDNYVFKRTENYEEMVIPYFFVEPGQNVAEVLQKLAVASQTAMFFDEFNNFVCMSKEYMLPKKSEREVDTALLGQETAYDENENSYPVIGYIYDEQELENEKEFGCYINLSNNSIYEWSDQSLSWTNVANLLRIDKPNIVSFSSKDKKVFNSGQINYTVRYLQRSIGSTTAALKTDEYKNYIYKPVLLWEAQGNQNRQTINELGGQMDGYVLGALPLNTDLTNEPPYVLNNTIYNNIIDVGENVYWMTNYQGYFYANGEIIKYDAIEYIVAGVSGPIWITNNQQYQDYFSKLKFNGKMYPTGRVRIYTDPEFEEDNGVLKLKDANPILVHGRGQFGTPIVSHSAGLINDNYWLNDTYIRGGFQEADGYLFNTSAYINYPEILENSAAGKQKTIDGEEIVIDANTLSTQSIRTGVIKNFLADKQFTENDFSYKKTTSPGTIQSSALIFKGPDVPLSIPASNFVSYIHKDFFDSDESNPYKHFGTRMRIVGKIEGGTNKSQTPIGSFPVYNGSSSTFSPPVFSNEPNQEEIIRGSSGGIAFNINKETNTGYYFEIMALTISDSEKYENENNANIINFEILSSPAAQGSVVDGKNVVTAYTDSEITFEVGQTVIVRGLSVELFNGEFVISYVGPDKKSFQYEISSASSAISSTAGIVSVSTAADTNIANVFFYKVVADENGNAIPYKLWSGLTLINVDSGDFYGQGRLMGEQYSTVYDMAAEYINIGSSRRFYLYLNNKQIAVVDDNNPLLEINSLSLFVRGPSKCMFENVYALANNYSQNSIFPIQNGIANIFGDEEIDATESFRKYAISGIVQKTYLSGISSMEEPKYKIYFEEFGTILREAAYFNVLYDRAYPSLYAKLMKTTNDLKGYTTSGFYAWSYGAEFLIFNATDFAITIDDTSGNYLRIMGVAFTQNTTYSMTVDDLYKKRSNLLDTALGKTSLLYNPLKIEQQFNKIKNSRDRYGKNEITIESPYIQTTDSAENIFAWIIEKVSRPRKMIGLEAFGVLDLQLGDIVNIKYLSNDGIQPVAKEDELFVIYQIENNYDSSSGPKTTLFLAEA